METSKNNTTHPKNIFTVTLNDINNNNALLPAVLYTKMETFVKEKIAIHSDIVYPIPQLFKLQILKNAYLEDQLVLNSQIKQLNDFELHLTVVVSLKNSAPNDIICKSIFKFPLKKYISKAS